jgi:hypothetical protein
MDGAGQHAVPAQTHLASPINGICRPMIPVERPSKCSARANDPTAYPE